MKEPIASRLKLDPRKLPAQVFERYTARAGIMRDRERREAEAWENFGKPGRDPNTLASLVTVLARHDNWMPHLKLAQLRNHWDQVVGPQIAQHSQVASWHDGVLTIRTASPSWTTTLTYMVPQLTDTIRERLDGLDIREIKVTGPQAHPFGGRYRHRR
ncbi:DUF721 domain-containing protein [Bifidobacterium thermophilum]|uniref:DUF721 domain-containing protein n=1 Tax=Bifidobacterium thermophilum TaxID=33905 RepID=UPI0030B4D19E